MHKKGSNLVICQEYIEKLKALFLGKKGTSKKPAIIRRKKRILCEYLPFCRRVELIFVQQTKNQTY